MQQQGPPKSPNIYESGDYQGNVIRITVVFDEGTGALTSVTVYRDAACVYTKLLLGKGADGSPSTTTRTVSVPAGTTVVPLVALASRGITTITDYLALQITASP